MADIANGTQPLEMLPYESKLLGVDFADWGFAGDEALTGTPSVAVTLRGAAPGAELTVGAPVINGTIVQFQVTTAGALPGSVYLFDVRCATTSSPNQAQAIRELEILRRG